MTKDELMGFAHSSVHALCNAATNPIKLRPPPSMMRHTPDKPPDCGSLVVRDAHLKVTVEKKAPDEEWSSGEEKMMEVGCKLRCTALPKADLLGGTDGFIRIMRRLIGGNEFVEVSPSSSAFLSTHPPIRTFDCCSLPHCLPCPK